MLLELMVGLAVGALAIAVALASLMVARSASASVTELASLQQQASHALRAIGRQVRSAGSRELQESPSEPGSFRFVEASAASSSAWIRGTQGANDSLIVGQTSPPLLPSFQRDCLGQGAPPGATLQARFDVDGKQNLRCKGASASPQPLISGVTAFKLRYRVVQNGQVRSLQAAQVDADGLWPAVTAVEVCLELRSEQRFAGGRHPYVDCLNRSSSTDGRLTLVTRKLFLLNASIPEG